MSLLEFDSSTFQACYNRMPFSFRHNLAGHPLMQLDAITAICKRLPR